MGCLTHEQILLQALGLQQDAQVPDHLRTCRSCREQVEAYRTLPEPFAARHTREKSDHEAAKERLLAALPDRYSSPPTGSPVGLVLSPYRRTRLGGFVMRHRFALGGTIVASVALLLGWILLSPSRLSAMEQTAEAFRKVKSYQCDMAMEFPNLDLKIQPPKMKSYWQAGQYRHETLDGEKVVSVGVFSTDGPGLWINHRRKTYSRKNARRGKQPPLATVQWLGKLSGKADKDLGSKQIGQIEARGFRIAMEKVDPDAGDGTLTVWVTVDSNLPVLVVYDSPTMGGTMRMENFQWDVPLGTEFFNPQPPADYEDTTPAPPDPDEQVTKITAALKIYADAFDGHYPQVDRIYGDWTAAELRKKLGGMAIFDPESSKHEAYPRYTEATQGFGAITRHQSENSDSAYFGKTVGPKDSGKVLHYWKLDDGSYMVIYGDLKSESVTELRLRSSSKTETTPTIRPCSKRSGRVVRHCCGILGWTWFRPENECHPTHY